MTFSETGFQPNTPISKNIPELQSELEGIDQERCNLCHTVEGQWPKIPYQAIAYLANNCPKPELMSAVISEISHLLNVDPRALDDLDLLPLIIDDCIASADDSLSDAHEDATEDAAQELDTMAAVLIHISAATANLNGRAKLSAATVFLINPDIPETVRQRLSARFSNISNTLDQMEAVFTDEASQAEFQSIIGSATFDLGAPNISTVFAPMITQVEASDKFTHDQKMKLRQIVTGSDAQDSLRETITDEHGIIQPRYTQKRQREIRTGVSGYVEGHGRQMIEASAGDHLVTKDVTGWSGENVGLLIETLHMWNTLEGFGVTGFVENIYSIDFSILSDSNAFDPLQINQMRQVLSHLVGSFEGYDGDIATLEDHKALLQNQARLLSETQTAFGWQNDNSGTTRTLRKLGLQDSEGHPNLGVIKAFGDYTKQYYFNGEIDQDRLAKHLEGADKLS